MEEAMEETTNTLYVKQKRNRNGTTMDKRISCAIKARKEGRYSCRIHLVVIHLRAHLQLVKAQLRNVVFIQKELLPTSLDETAAKVPTITILNR